MEINFADKRVREKLAENYYEEQQYITHFLQKLAAPLLMVSNEGDVVNQVRRLLGVPGVDGRESIQFEQFARYCYSRRATILATSAGLLGRARNGCSHIAARRVAFIHGPQS